MEYITSQIEANPLLKRSAVKKLFDEHGHCLIYTPAYLPEVQPIESLWGMAKRKVAAQNFVGCSLQETQAQLIKAMNSITPQQFADFIKCTHDFIKKWIIDDDKERLEQFKSFENLINNKEFTVPYEYHTYNSTLDIIEEAESPELAA